MIDRSERKKEREWERERDDRYIEKEIDGRQTIDKQTIVLEIVLPG